jgi:hypothetical protein
LIDEKASVALDGVVRVAYEHLAEDKSVRNSVDSAKFDATANNVVQKIVL